MWHEKVFQLIHTSAHQSGVSSHFGSCSALPFAFFAVFCVFFAKLKQKNTLNFTMQFCCEASDSMLGKIKGLYSGIQGLFKDFWQSWTFQEFTIKYKDFSRLYEPWYLMLLALRFLF